MIEILTLFAGLLTGPQPVALKVSPAVAEVELRLDGESVARLSGPPWRADVDLGEDLKSHQLAVVARAEDGRELQRLVRRLNVAAASYGQLVGDGSADLPLTPIAIELDSGVELPPVAEMQGWFLAGDRPLEVVTVRRGRAEVIMVRHPAVQPFLDEMVRFWIDLRMGEFPVDEPLRALDGGKRAFLDALRRAHRQLDPAREGRRLGEIWEEWHGLLLLGEDTSIRFIAPRSGPVASVAVRKDVFNITSAQSSGGRDGMLYQAVQVRPLRSVVRVVDAVAVAGFEAHAGRTRRAVVALLPGDLADLADESQFRPAQVADYLAELQVPWFNWSFDQEAEPDGSGEGTSADRRPVRSVIYPREARVDDPLHRFKEAFAELRRGLAAQRVVWLAGRHLPRQVRLSESVAGIRLAGDPPVEPLDR